MPKVPEYQPNVALRPAFRQGVDVNASAEAFGADIGRGMESLARGGRQLQENILQVRDLEDTMRAKDADNTFSNWLRNRMYGDGGFMTLEGRNAVDGREAFEREAEEKRKEFSQGLTPGAARHYNDASTARVQSAYQQSAVHTGQARKTWFGEAAAARVETFGNDALANFNRPDLVDKNVRAGLAEIRQTGQMKGWDADTLKAKETDFVSGVRKNITMRMAETDPIAADKYMKDHSGQLTGPHMYELEHSLSNRVKEEQSKREADGILSAGRQAATEATPGRRTVGQSGPTTARANLTGRLVAGHGKDHIDNLDEGFATNLNAMVQDAPPNIREGLGVLSGYRTPERQKELWDDAVKKYGSPEAARKYVAPPGASQHNHGQAVDLSYNGKSLAEAPKEVVDWIHANASKYGLYFPMAHEPWHVEPVGSRSGTVSPRNNMVSPRAAMPSYADIEARINAISDPKVRDLTRKRVYSGLEAQSKAAEQAEKSARAELWRYIDEGKTPDQVPTDVRQAAGLSAVSAAWGYLETAKTGREVKTNETLLYDMRRYAATDPNGFAALDLNDYRDRLSKDAIKELTGTQTGALTDQRKAREDGLNLTAAFNQATAQLEAIGITPTGKKGAAAQAERLRVAQFNNALAEEMEAFNRDNKNKAPTQPDIQKMVNKLLLPVVVKTPGMLWDSKTEKRLFEAGSRSDKSTVDVNVKYEDIPIDLRRGIALDLEKDLGRKPSQQEVADRYENFVLNR